MAKRNSVHRNVDYKQRVRAVKFLGETINTVADSDDVDVGAVVLLMADVLIELGLDVEANQGGFGRPCSLTASGNATEG